MSVIFYVRSVTLLFTWVLYIGPLPANGLSLTEQRPIPDAVEIQRRVIVNQRESAKQKERYLCLVTEETDELGKYGEVKQRQTKEFERFYVNGQEVSHLLKKNGVALDQNAAKKEQDRVGKQVTKLSDEKQLRKVQDEEEKQLDLFLRALKYSNGRREESDGRSTIQFDVSGDPAFHPSGIEQEFVKALEGTISIDEETGELWELAVATSRDVKIAGGLLANLHKGFHLHVKQKRQADGVWLTSLAEGSGDARAGLFFHPRFRFRETTGHCRLYSVDAAGSASSVHAQ